MTVCGRGLGRVICAALVLSAAAATLAQQSVSPGTGPLYAAVPHSVRHANLNGRTLSAVPASESVHFAVSMQLGDAPGLKKFVEQVSDPNSPIYRHFIPPDEVGAKFGPAQADVKAIVAYLTSSGFTIDSVAKNNFVIFAHGTAQQVTAAFRTALVHVSTTDGKGNALSYRTNTSPLMMPASLVPKVLDIDGVDNSIRHRMRANTTQMDPFLARNVSGALTGYNAGYYGQGVNVAIANWDGFSLFNAQWWVTDWHMPIPSAGVTTNIQDEEVGSGPTYGSGSAGGEGDLDIQSVLMGAPLANIIIYDDSQDDDNAPLSTYSQISSDNTADIVTESYGWPTFVDSTYYGSFCTSCYNVHLSISAQGITYMAATGDSGTDELGDLTERYAYPTIDPTVLQVGGSIDKVNELNGQRVSSTSWGITGSGSNSAGGTGGFDIADNTAQGFAFNVAPSYQTGYISSQTSTYNFRLVPDTVGFSGGQDGWGEQNRPYAGWAFECCFGSTASQAQFDEFSGTSIASPTTAGNLGAILSHLYSTVTPNSTRSNVRLGEIQPLLYSYGGNKSVFYDITTGDSIGTLPGTTIAAVPTAGWDFATGWGELNFLGLYQALVAKGY